MRYIIASSAAALLVMLSSPVGARAQHVHEAPSSAPAAPEASPPADSSPAPTSATDQGLPPFIPPVTEAMREAAFPDVGDHAVHGETTHVFVLADHLEWRVGEEGALSAEINGWVGRDLNRAWFRTETRATGDDVEHVRAELLFGRAVLRWWDLVAGVRQDLRSGPARTWAVFGVQGLAPYWFEVGATMYVGGGGRTEWRLDAEYDLLVTNRLILQPSATLDLAGSADEARRIGAGFSHLETGARLRYEIRREFAPYVGLVWERALGETAEMRRADGGADGDRQFVVGVRAWW